MRSTSACARSRRGPTSVDEVARAAGVARSTVYLVFGTRVGLYDALMDRLTQGEGYEQLMAAVRDPDPLVSLRGATIGGVRMFAAHRDVLRVLFSLAELGPDDTLSALRRMEAERAAGITRLAGRLAAANLLRPGVSAKEAADILWVLAGFDAFDQLYTARGLSAKQVAKRLVATAERAYLRDPPTAA